MRSRPDTAPRDAEPGGQPPLPEDRTVTLGDGRQLWVRESGVRRPGQPTVVLLHGWTATADLNFFPLYQPLSRDHHVVAFDLRGHGRGPRPDRFTLEGCADDVAALAGALDLPAVVPVGYSMGGLVAQLTWRRHRDLVAGLVLCSTTRNFRGTPGDQVYFNGVSAMARAGRLAPPPMRARLLSRFLDSRMAALDLSEWGLKELARHDFQLVLEAGAAIGRFSSHDWAGAIDVPTAVVVSSADTKIPPRRQRKLAAAIPGAAVFEVDGDHHVCPRQPDRYVPVLLDALAHVGASGPRAAPVYVDGVRPGVPRTTPGTPRSPA
ncbi:MAG: alpha/beta fold hydrolase [Acidimicrobiales bacterium]